MSPTSRQEPKAGGSRLCPTRWKGVAAGWDGGCGVMPEDELDLPGRRTCSSRRLRSVSPLSTEGPGPRGPRVTTGVSRSKAGPAPAGLGAASPTWCGVSRGSAHRKLFCFGHAHSCPSGDQPDPGPREGARGSREPPLLTPAATSPPSHLPNFGPGSPGLAASFSPSPRAGLTAADTVLGSVGPASTVVT